MEEEEQNSSPDFEADMSGIIALVNFDIFRLLCTNVNVTDIARVLWFFFLLNNRKRSMATIYHKIFFEWCLLNNNMMVNILERELFDVRKTAADLFSCWQADDQKWDLYVTTWIMLVKLITSWIMLTVLTVSWNMLAMLIVSHLLYSESLSNPRWSKVVHRRHRF